MTPKLERALQEGVAALEGLDIAYAVVGGLAVGAWSVPRATRDVDLYAAIPTSVRPRLLRELQARGFHVPAMEEELERFGVFRSRSPEGFFLDIFNAAGPLGEAIISRRRQALLGGHVLWLVAPEDLALLRHSRIGRGTSTIWWCSSNAARASSILLTSRNGRSDSTTALGATKSPNASSARSAYAGALVALEQNGGHLRGPPRAPRLDARYSGQRPPTGAASR